MAALRLLLDMGLIDRQEVAEARGHAAEVALFRQALLRARERDQLALLWDRIGVIMTETQDEPPAEVPNPFLPPDHIDWLAASAPPPVQLAR